MDIKRVMSFQVFAYEEDKGAVHEKLCFFFVGIFHFALDDGDIHLSPYPTL